MSLVGSVATPARDVIDVLNRITISDDAVHTPAIVVGLIHRNVMRARRNTWDGEGLHSVGPSQRGGTCQTPRTG